MTKITLLTWSCFAMFLFSCNSKKDNKIKLDKYDGPAAIAAFEAKKTIDPALGFVPRDRLVPALKYADNVRNMFNRLTAAGSWVERGPNSDVVGSSNGNLRANSGVASGRVRGVLIDANDATGNTVWVGGVNGGLWRNTNIASASPTWTFVNDFFSNMAITSICQNPASPQTMYFATGEAFFNSPAVGGDGIWKSTNGGTTWNQLPSTTNFNYISKIVCDASGNLYAALSDGAATGSISGLRRSNDGGVTWTLITPSGLSTSRFSDIEISSTGRLHVSAGIFSTCGYRYTDNPSTVTSATWTAPASGYPASSIRIELGCSGSTLIALPSNGSYQVPTIFKSTDGGANWAATTGQPTSGWAGGQGWYNLAADFDPSNVNNIVVGGLDPYKTTDGGATWTKLADWTSNPGLPPATTQYVHADVHFIDWYSSNRIIFGCDGGIHYTSDGGTTIRDRNVGLRIKQFYSVDVNPTSGSNIFLGGTQDNGVHQFSTAGLGNTIEVTGGDGAFVHIDQNAAANMFGSYIFNIYRRSTNTGASWSTINFYRGSPGTYGVTFDDFGQFINPSDFDDVNNIMYASSDAGEFFRWTTPLTTASGTYYSATNFATANASIVSLTNFGGANVTALTVSPYTANRVYFGTDGGRVVYADGANTIVTGSAGTNISTGLPIADVSCVAIGTTDNNLIATYSNYGVNNVWVSTNGGTSWTAIDGNLPDMPVRWAMFYPGDNTKVLLATEAGVWITELVNGASTSWYVSSTFPLVRTDMLKYRASDGIIAAATHGRGLWTQSATTVLPINDFKLSTIWNNESNLLRWSYENATANTKFEILASFDGKNFSSVGFANYNGTTNYSFTYTPTQTKIFYRIKAIEYNTISRYSNITKLDKGIKQFELLPPSPNPIGDLLNAPYNTNATGFAKFDIIDATGKIVLSQNERITARGSYFYKTNTSKLAKGQYTLVMQLNDYRAVQRFVKL